MPRATLLLVALAALFLTSCGEEAARVPAAPVAVAELTLVRTSAPDARARFVASPLEQVQLADAPAAGAMIARDATGRVYWRGSPAAKFSLRGALGTHRIELLDGRGTVIGATTLRVDARTGFTTGSGRLDRFLTATMAEVANDARDAVVDGKRVRTYVGWLRDDTHALKATKYHEPDVTSLVQVFLDHQRPDGMVYDLFTSAGEWDPHGQRWLAHNSRLNIWGPAWAGFTSDQRHRLERIPVEADVEYLLVENAYQVWQATGDDAWLAQRLPALERAMRYSMTSPLRWSPEHRLVKRGFTIDTWDFQHRLVEKAHPNGNKNPSGWWDHMWIDERTPWCLMHGDNTGMMQACTQLARMHERLGNADASRDWAAEAEAFRAGLDRVCWNGRFFTHQVHLDPIPGDVGVDEAAVLSLSNAYALNRGIAGVQAASIIREYQQRRATSKDRSFAEWFTIDPPFTSGFADRPGDYVNGGVSPIIAGELARGAFAHGFEAYGVDILQRVAALQERDREIHAVYHPTPRQPDWREGAYTTLDLRPAANRSFAGGGADGWTGEGDNDLSPFPTGEQRFLGKPFDIIAADGNGARQAIALRGGRLQDLPESVTIPVGRTASSCYVLHAHTQGQRGRAVAIYRWDYADGTTAERQVWDNGQIANWWGMTDRGEMKVAWRGANARSTDIAIGCFGWSNPHPEREIRSITFRSAGNGVPLILAATLSEVPVQWEWGHVSHGVPDVWAAAAVYAAAVEGLAGVVDDDRAFAQAIVSPRWLAAGEDSATAVVRYAASEGYVAYRWSHDRAARRVVIDVTGSGDRATLRLPLPRGEAARLIRLGDGTVLQAQHERFEHGDFAYVLVPLSADERDRGLVTIDY